MLRLKIPALLVLATALCFSGYLVFAGPIDPPAGSVTGTYKTLLEVEPRTAINAINTPGDADSLFRITQPGSYYLTGNITGVSGKQGIEIEASSVTIDLMGFEMSGGAGTLRGIGVAGSMDSVTIRNGTLKGWDGAGIDTAAAGADTIISDINAFGNGAGAGSGGIRAGPRSTVRNCTARANRDSGIDVGEGSVVVNCACSQNTYGILLGQGSTAVGCAAAHNSSGINTGPHCVVSQCSAIFNTAIGIEAGLACTVTDCSSGSNGGDGIFANNESTIQNCTACGNTGDGIEVNRNTLVLNNSCNGNGNGAGIGGDGAGINIVNFDNRIDGNNVTNNDRGIDCNPATGNLIVRNSASGNTTNYDIVAGNSNAQVLSPGAGFATTNAWANFSF